MALRKAIGIVVFAAQSVVAADYFIQTRDAGLVWGELSSADYAAIVRARFAGGAAGSHSLAELASGVGREEPISAADPGGNSKGEAPGICIRRGTALQCN
ncbi:hypothetical protein [Cribrihabitans neustonicus]|uniref:hypothetical protein n=1 Tax=Cribrihabitans neustonicus TaxID=1429085 RepID=UPI003B5A0CA1